MTSDPAGAEAGAPLVLVTGATGSVGKALRPALHDYRIRVHGLDVHDVRLAAHEEAVGGDIVEPGVAERLVEGCDAVVHLAGQADCHASWDDLHHPNILGVHRVFDAARLGGVRRLIFASTNHVTGLRDRARDWPIAAGDPVAPDSRYAVTKVFGEALGRFYAATTPMSVVCLRIGWVLDQPFDEESRRLWLSPRDLGRLVRAGLTADVRFGVYYGVSANQPLRYDLAAAARDLGYRPEDGAEQSP